MARAQHFIAEWRGDTAYVVCGAVGAIQANAASGDLLFQRVTVSGNVEHFSMSATNFDMVKERGYWQPVTAAEARIQQQLRLRKAVQTKLCGPAKDQEGHFPPTQPRIGVTFGTRGFFAVMYDDEGAIQTSDAPCKTYAEAQQLAREWAKADQIPLNFE